MYEDSYLVSSCNQILYFFLSEIFVDDIFNEQPTTTNALYKSVANDIAVYDIPCSCSLGSNSIMIRPQ